MAELTIPQRGQPNPPQYPLEAINSLVTNYLNRPAPMTVASAQIQQGLGALANYQLTKQERQLQALSAISQMYGNMPRDVAQQYIPQVQRMYGLDMGQPSAQGQAPSPVPPNGGDGFGGNAQSSAGPSTTMNPGQGAGYGNGTVAMSSGQAGATPPSASSQGTPQSLTGTQTEPMEPLLAAAAAGHPDFAGHLARIQQIQDQISGLSNEGPAYAQKMMPTLTGRLSAEKAAMDAQMIPLTYLQKEKELSLMSGKPQAEVAKDIGDKMSQIKNLQSTFDQLTSIQNSPANKSIPFTGQIGAWYAKQNPNTQSQWALNQRNAADIADVGAGAIEKLVEGRYNDYQMQRIREAFFPVGNELGTDQGNRKLTRFQNYINQMRSGAIDQANSQLDAIAGGGFNPTNMGKPEPFPSANQSPKNVPSVKNQKQYDALPNGAQYMWNGKLHIKGRS